MATSNTMYPDISREEMLPYVPAGVETVLDIGCNTGAFGALLKRNLGCTVHGVDPNPVAAEIASRRLDWVKSCYFDKSLELPNEQYDLIVINDVVEHVVDVEGFLLAVRGKLKSNGAVVASIPNFLNLENIKHIWFERDFRYEEMGVRDRTHLRFFTRKSIVRTFHGVGFSIEKMGGINERWWSKSIMQRLAFKILGAYLEETKYQQFAVVARKLER
jgi:2-polyprenyl-3-methyl-5-hydroxy-6-metoxy-1,4-benzoquinol methylase